MLVIEGPDNLGKTTAAHRLVNICAVRASDTARFWNEHAECEEPECECRKVVPTTLPYPVFYSHMSRPNCAFNFFTHYQERITTYGVQDRFHLGGIVWHENAICDSTLQQIESWLTRVGSMVVVFYCSDEDWYRERLKTSNRIEMFDIDTILAANRKFMSMVLGEQVEGMLPRIDHSFDINPGARNSVYPTDEMLNQLADLWYKRLEFIDC